MKFYSTIHPFQRGQWQTFKAFIDKYLSKWSVERENYDVRDTVDLFWQQPIPAQFEKDLTEPDAVNVVLEHESTTWNAMGQATQTLAKAETKDKLHCTIGGNGERISIVSPFQRIGMQIGSTKVLNHPEMEQPVEVSLPNYHSFTDLNRAEVPREDQQYFKPFHVDNKPGDCVYIPAFWWYQIEAQYALAPKHNASKKEIDNH